MATEPTNGRNVVVGLAVTVSRAGATAGRSMLWPVRIVEGLPFVRGRVDVLAATGREAELDSRRRLEGVAESVLAAPEAGAGTRQRARRAAARVGQPLARAAPGDGTRRARDARRPADGEARRDHPLEPRVRSRPPSRRLEPSAARGAHAARGGLRRPGHDQPQGPRLPGGRSARAQAARLDASRRAHGGRPVRRLRQPRRRVRDRPARRDGDLRHRQRARRASHRQWSAASARSGSRSRSPEPPRRCSTSSTSPGSGRSRARRRECASCVCGWSGRPARRRVSAARCSA